MSVQIDDATINHAKALSEAAGALAVFSTPFIFIYRYVTKIRADVDVSKKDIRDLKETINAADFSRKELHTKVNELSERTVRVETKIDFLVQNIEKIKT